MYLPAALLPTEVCGFLKSATVLVIYSHWSKPLLVLTTNATWVSLLIPTGTLLKCLWSTNQNQHHLHIHRLFPMTASFFLTSRFLLLWKYFTTLIYSKGLLLVKIQVFTSFCLSNCLISTAVSTREGTRVWRRQLHSSGCLYTLIKNHSYQLQLMWFILW